MKKITIRDLRNRGGQVVDRVLAGERLLVTRDGHANLGHHHASHWKPVYCLSVGVRCLNVDGQALTRDR